MAIAGAPGSVAPMTSKSPADMCARYQSRGHVRAEMRVVGEQRLAAGGQRAVDHPVVRAERFEPSAAEQQLPDRVVAAERPRRTRSTSSRRPRRWFPAIVLRLGRPLAGCVRSFDGRLVEDAQSVLRIRRHQLGSPLRSDAGEHVAAQQLERVVRAEIPGHHLDPHQDVGPGPRLRLEAQQRELRRQRAAMRWRGTR